MLVTYADPSNIPQLSILFDQYRIFYEQETDIDGAEVFLKARFKQKDSTIIISTLESNIIGFIQLYPSFSSVSMKRVWILNDLFVTYEFRRKNVARKLIEAAKVHAKDTEAVRLELATQTSNTPAQKLYEAMGFIRDESFFHYSFKAI